MPASPLTRAERSGWRATTTHAELLDFLAALDGRGDPRWRLTDFGRSVEGRSLPLVVLSRDGIATPEQARAASRPVVLLLCGIHPGEVEGKEAALMLLRDWLGGQDRAVLDALTLLVVPLFNPDGNDRIHPDNRKLELRHLMGQLGPEEGVGTRANAQGINLNRDYLRQDAPESRLLSTRVFQAWQPHLTIDCHATNGSVHRYALTYDTPHTVESGPKAPMDWVRLGLLPAVTAGLKARTGLDTFFYGNFLADEGKSGEGWATYTHHPRFGSNYRGLTGRADLLLETYSYLPFADRVHTTYAFVRESLAYAAAQAEGLLAAVEAGQTPPQTVAVRYRLDAEEAPARILTRTPRRLDGAPTEVTVPHLARWVGAETVRRPWAYAVPPALVTRLAGHGLRLRCLQADMDATVETAQVEAVQGLESRNILEASAAGEVELLGTYDSRPTRLPAGTWLLETDQALGALATYLCELRSDDGVVQCGWLPVPGVGEEFGIRRVWR